MLEMTASNFEDFEKKCLEMWRSDLEQCVKTFTSRGAYMHEYQDSFVGEQWYQSLIVLYKQRDSSLAIKVITVPRIVKLVLLCPLQPDDLVYPLSSFFSRKWGGFASHVGAAPSWMHANKALLFLQVFPA